MFCAEGIARSWSCWSWASLHFPVTSSKELTMSCSNENNTVVTSHPIILMTIHELPFPCVWLKYMEAAWGIESKSPTGRDQSGWVEWRRMNPNGKQSWRKSERSRVTSHGVPWILHSWELWATLPDELSPTVQRTVPSKSSSSIACLHHLSSTR